MLQKIHADYWKFKGGQQKVPDVMAAAKNQEKRRYPQQGMSLLSGPINLGPVGGEEDLNGITEKLAPVSTK
jgi:hypothetical protein